MSDVMTVKYSRLPSQGVVYGLNGVAFAAAVVATLIVGVAAIRSGIVGVLVSLPLWGSLALLGIKKRHGEPLITHVGREIVGITRKGLGLNVHKRRPEKRHIQEVGVLTLPGRDNRLHLWETAQGHVAVWDAQTQTVSVTCLVATAGLSVATPKEVTDRVNAWATVLGSWTQRPHIRRVMTLEHSRPGTVAAERIDYARRATTGNSAVHDSYRETLERAEAAVVSHRTQLVFTIDASGSEAKALVKAHGGGKAGVLGLAELEMESVTEALRAADFHRVQWVTPREWAAWGRGIIDPVSQASIDLRIGTEHEGVDPQAAGPMFVRDERTWVETDSAFHRTFWIREWPRTETYPGFLNSVVFASTREGRPVRHTFAIVATPMPLDKALDRVEEEKRTWITNQTLKAKMGRPQNAADEADWRNIEAHERALVAGQGEMTFSAYLTVTALDRDELERATATMRNACSIARIETQVLPWQQAEALMNVAFPSGTGMK